MKQPLVSVIIINYNGKDFLDTCFKSLLKTNYLNFEIIFVDNASVDNSVNFLKQNFDDRRIKIYKSENNLGVPGGRNLGFEKAKGEYIVYLDNDTEVDSEWIIELIKVFEADPKIGVAQAKLLSMTEKNRFDHAGDFLTPSGFLFERSSQAQDKGQFDKVGDIFNAKGAATMIKSSVFVDLGLYDESYFMYQEETDFCYRAWLGGFRVVFVPTSIVYHAFNTPLKETKRYYSNYVVRFYGCRNYILTLLKNLSVFSLIKILPLHLFSWLIMALVFLLKGKFHDSYWILKGISWNFFHILETDKKRTFIQLVIRKKSDDYIFNKVMIRKSAMYYFKKALLYINS